MIPTKEQLEDFYWKVARATLHHEVICDAAVIYADIAGTLLEEINPEWWDDKRCKKPIRLNRKTYKIENKEPEIKE